MIHCGFSSATSEWHAHFLAESFLIIFLLFYFTIRFSFILRKCPKLCTYSAPNTLPMFLFVACILFEKCCNIYKIMKYRLTYRFLFFVSGLLDLTHHWSYCSVFFFYILNFISFFHLISIFHIYLHPNENNKPSTCSSLHSKNAYIYIHISINSMKTKRK